MTVRLGGGLVVMVAINVWRTSKKWVMKSKKLIKQMDMTHNKHSKKDSKEVEHIQRKLGWNLTKLKHTSLCSCSLSNVGGRNGRVQLFFFWQISALSQSHESCHNFAETEETYWIFQKSLNDSVSVFSLNRL